MVSYVRYQVSGARCPVSGVILILILICFNNFKQKLDKLVELFSEGSGINGAYLVWFYYEVAISNKSVLLEPL